MFQVEDKIVYGMASVRFISSCIEFVGACLMIYFGTAEKALQVNGALALVGPLVLVTVTFLGIAGMAGQMQWTRIAVILMGVGCILYGARA